MNILAQNQTMTSLDKIKHCLRKLENNEPLSLEEQCMTVIFSGAIDVNVTRDYFEKLTDSSLVDFDDIVLKFIDNLPSSRDCYSGKLLRDAFCSSGNTKERYKKNIKTYIVRKIGTNEVKIGKSIDPRFRMRTLSSQGGSLLEFLAIIDADIESILHRKFCKIRTVGEWFDDTSKEILKFSKDVNAIEKIVLDSSL